MAQAPTTRSAEYPILPGVALIVNQLLFQDEQTPDRPVGAIVDEQSLENLFKLMDYKCGAERDCPRGELESCVRRAVKLFDRDHDGPFFLCIMTHGNSYKVCMKCDEKYPRGMCRCSSDAAHSSMTYLVFPDGKTASTESITKLFLIPDIYQKLKGRPKIVLIQACKGTEPMTPLLDGSNQPKDDFMADVHYPVGATDPLADIVFFESCIEGRPSFISLGYGSFFVTTFCNAMLRGLTAPAPYSFDSVLREVTRVMHEPMVIKGQAVYLTPQINRDSRRRDLYMTLFTKEKRRGALRTELQRIQNLMLPWRKSGRR